MPTGRGKDGQSSPPDSALSSTYPAENEQEGQSAHRENTNSSILKPF